MITHEQAYLWKANSIMTAREMGLVHPHFAETLRAGVGIEIDDSPRPEWRWYGKADCHTLEVVLYRENPTHWMPKPLRDIINQSGMDHELIGHIGNHLQREPDDEQAACQTQYEMAVYRGRESRLWGIFSGLLPRILYKHKGVCVTTPEQISSR